MRNILALLRQRRPHRDRSSGNGSWRDIELETLGGPVASGRADGARIAAPGRQGRRHDPRREPGHGYLAAQGLEGVTWRGMPLSGAWPCAAALVGFSLLFLTVALWRLRRCETRLLCKGEP